MCACVCVRKAPGVREEKEMICSYISSYAHPYIHITKNTGKHAVYGQHSPGRHGVDGKEGKSKVLAYDCFSISISHFLHSFRFHLFFSLDQAPAVDEELVL